MDNTAAAEPDLEMLAEFERFNRRGYAFTAVQGGVVGWILHRIWLIPLGMILVNILVIAAALSMLDDHRAAIETASTWVRSSGFDYGLLGRMGDETEPVSVILDQNTRDTASLLYDSDVYLLPTFAIFLCAAAFYTFFIQRTPKSLYRLARTNSLIPRYGPTWEPRRLLPGSSHSYASDLEKALQGRWGKYFALLFQILVIILVYRFAVERGSIEIIQTAFWPLRIGEFILIFIFPVVAGPLIALGLWVIIVMGVYLTWLTPTFKLNVIPYHHDGCGGLKPVGDIALMIALIFIVPGILLGYWAFGGLLEQSIEAVTLLTYFSLVIVVMSVIAFILPVIRAHREMARQKTEFQERYLEDADSRIEALKDRLRELVARGEDQGQEGRALKYRLELLEKLYPDRVVYRTWPFGYAALGAFALGQSILLQLPINWASDFVGGILSGQGG